MKLSEETHVPAGREHTEPLLLKRRTIITLHRTMYLCVIPLCPNFRSGAKLSEPQWQLIFCIEFPTAGTTGLCALLSSPTRYIPQAFQLKFDSAGPPAGYWPVPVLHARTCSARALFLIIYRGLV